MILTKESSAHTIDLHGDDRNAVKGMIAHFYGKSSQTDQYFPKELAPPVPRRDSTEYIKYLVDLYITATKHLAYSLQDRIKCMLEDFDNIHFGLNLTTVVHHIYVRHKDAETTSFRTQVARVTAEAVESLVQDDLSRKLLLEVPDFALDVIQALADQKSATSANGGNGKRQRR